MIDKERARVWVQALRSGEFEQGTGALSRNGKMCCLGVLCKTLEDEGVLQSQSFVGGDTAWGDSSGFIPGADVSLLMGLEGDTSFNPAVVYDGQYRELWALNDVHRLSFAQIADLIEQEFDL